jgi:hypothetical protein
VTEAIEVRQATSQPVKENRHILNSIGEVVPLNYIPVNGTQTQEYSYNVSLLQLKELLFKSA